MDGSFATLAILAVLAHMVATSWIIGAVLLLVAKQRGASGVGVEVARLLWAELRPIYPLAVVVAGIDNAVAPPFGSRAYALFILAVHVVCWFVYKDISDDDRR